MNQTSVDVTHLVIGRLRWIRLPDFDPSLGIQICTSCLVWVCILHIIEHFFPTIPQTTSMPLTIISTETRTSGTTQTSRPSGTMENSHPTGSLSCFLNLVSTVTSVMLSKPNAIGTL